MPTVLIILAIAFGIAFLFILASSLFSSAWIFQLFNRPDRTEPQADHPAEDNEAQDAAGRALDLVGRLSPDAEAYKCRKCGATVDSTAELSADGKVKCNYCNSWSSIY